MRNLNTVFQSRPSIHISWPKKLDLTALSPSSRRQFSGRRRSNSKDRSFDPKVEHVSSLKTSFSIAETIRHLKERKWSLFDLQYVVLATVCLSSLWIIEAHAPFIKSAAVVGYTLLLLMPATSQFFLPSWPIWTYLLYFFSSRYIPNEVRPHIWVKVLPALENVLYGANLSNILSAHTHPILDVFAWIPYGIGHFGNPAICSILIFLFAAPKTLPVFAKSFGWLSMIGVTLALVLPCTPPWYENMYGLAPAHYGMPGSPAGLARIDALFGVDMYTTSFSTAPVPFGAFPSLHAGDATIEALFMIYCFPRFKGFFIFYVGWLWWATMYLSHHYAVDLVGGSLIASIIFFIARTRYLPYQQADKSNRWEYDFIEVGEMKKTADEELGYGMGLLERRGTGDSDEWSVGSSTLYSPNSPTIASGSASPTFEDGRRSADSSCAGSASRSRF
ncbi:putative Phosphatidic acid phosphatase type 2/haloperoxidase domain-containing protein [Seiridium unicorne]|uniref:Phosphatidic acid phosphatase type 2/haloperoxidase domain-containing protein n=1 Tax=Seiridium unicorne TaxID=138068 RepID=A0ABR2UFZ6_9PEZI